MSSPIIPPAAAVTDDVATAPTRRRCDLEPGLRIIEGRVFYSAAWLDQAARTLRTSDSDARSAGRPEAGLGD